VRLVRGISLEGAAMRILLSEFVKNFIKRQHNVPDRSSMGYQFQWELAEKILLEFGDWPSVTFTDGRGELVTLENFRRKGKDGGIDLVIEVDAKRPQDVKRIETIIINFIMAM
jgi:hypothetical protein